MEKTETIDDIPTNEPVDAPEHSDPVAVADDGTTANSDEPRKRRSRRGKSRNALKLERERRISRNLKIMLAVLLVALAAVLVVGSKNQTHLVDQNNKLEDAVKRLRVRAKKAESLVDRLRTEVETMVAARLPGLNEMTFEEVIPLNDRYVKNVILGVSKDEGRTTYEYRFALFNRETTPIVPRFAMYLFDKNGMQVGEARVTDDGEASEGLSRALAPGEIRSYNGTAAIMEGKTPHYFMVNIH